MAPGLHEQIAKAETLLAVVPSAPFATAAYPVPVAGGGPAIVFPSVLTAPGVTPPSSPGAKKLGDLCRRLSGDDPDELLKSRYLCRGGGLLLVGPTGVGKSTLAMQAALCFAGGRSFVGIEPAKPLRVLVIQAENDDGDLAEMRDGILAGLCLDEHARAQALADVWIYTETTRTGLDFCAQTVGRLVALHQPDLVIIDPALSYLGGDASSQRDVSAFLRGGLTPILKQYGCGVILVHHTNKPPAEKKKANWQGGDFAYLGSGSAEWANWARAVIALQSEGEHGRFKLTLGKRGQRAGWKHADGITTRFEARLAHANGSLYWREVSEDEDLMAGVQDPNGPKCAKHLLPFVPKGTPIRKDALVSMASQAGIAINRAKGFIAELLETKELYEWQRSRSGTRPEILVATFPQPGDGDPAEEKMRT